MRTYHTHFGVHLGNTPGWWDDRKRNQKPVLPLYLRLDIPSNLSRELSCLLLKSLLGVKKATETHCVLRETGQMPLFFYWFRCTVRFWNCLLNTNNVQGSWTCQFLHALNDVPNSERFPRLCAHKTIFTLGNLRLFLVGVVTRSSARA